MDRSIEGIYRLLIKEENIMKKLICVLLAVMTLLSLTACGGGTKTEEKNVPAPNMTDVFASMHAQLPSDAVAALWMAELETLS